jgi:hypothetical protein
MDRSYWQELVDQLRGKEYQDGPITPGSPVHRVEFDAGLTDTEVTEVESRFGFLFPPDLREFLQTALSRGPLFPDWRSGDETGLREWLDRPRQGILFDVEHNGFWPDEWGSKPGSLEEALRVASEQVAAAPRLIPIYADRMMPDEPQEPGNPVFSVQQTDINYYGFDLTDYFRHEFGLSGRDPQPQQMRPIRFWGINQVQEAALAESPQSFEEHEEQLNAIPLATGAQRMSVCPQCGGAMGRMQAACPRCGYDFPLLPKPYTLPWWAFVGAAWVVWVLYRGNPIVWGVGWLLLLAIGIVAYAWRASDCRLRSRSHWATRRSQPRKLPRRGSTSRSGISGRSWWDGFDDALDVGALEAPAPGVDLLAGELD